jgi:deoxyribose-phosphate aldolase
MVIAIGALREGRTQYVLEDIKAVVQAAHGRCVKVILETALLTDEQIVTATELSCQAGAHFVKTCTGFAGGGATVEHVKLMKQHVTDGVLVKASGGIKDYQTALALVQAGADRLGTSSGMQIVQGEE